MQNVPGQSPLISNCIFPIETKFLSNILPLFHKFLNPQIEFHISLPIFFYFIQVSSLQFIYYFLKFSFSQMILQTTILKIFPSKALVFCVEFIQKILTKQRVVIKGRQGSRTSGAV